jgi:hypothetical protein
MLEIMYKTDSHTILISAYDPSRVTIIYNNLKMMMLCINHAINIVHCLFF